MYWLNLLQFVSLGVPCPIQIPPQLEIHPKPFAITKELGQTQCSAWGNSSLAIDDFVHSLIRYAYAFSQLSLSQLHGI